MVNDIPNFLIIGAAKAATTTLAVMLTQHPQAGIVANKEPHYFSFDEQYNKGWSWYQSCFSHCQDKLAIGDASTSYSRIRYHPKTLERILFHVPHVKIIYMVRHPLNRIVSAYIGKLASEEARHAYPTINQAVRADPMIIDSSRYWEVFNHYRRYISEERIKIVWFEEFIANPGGGFQEICRFLEIDDTLEIQVYEKLQNSRAQVLSHINQVDPGSARRINTEWDSLTRQWVIDQIRDDICEFLTYFRKPQDYWEDLYCT